MPRNDTDIHVYMMARQTIYNKEKCERCSLCSEFLGLDVQKSNLRKHVPVFKVYIVACLKLHNTVYQSNWLTMQLQRLLIDTKVMGLLEEYLQKL